VDRVRRGNATSNSCPAETPKESEVVECETAPGGEPGVNIKCCAEEPEWECCGVLECVANDYSPPPPPPPPASSPPPPLSPSSPPPSPFTWGWSLVGSDVDGEAAFEAFGDAVAVSLDGTRVAVGSPSADDDEIGANVGRVRVYERVGGAGDWTQVGADLTLGDVGFMSEFGAAVSLSNDGKKVVVGAPRYGDGDAGLVRLYEETNGVWKKVGQDLTGGDVGADVIWYGRKLTMSSTNTIRLAVAGTVSGANTGFVRTYLLDTEEPYEWMELASGVVLGDAAAGDESGWDLDLSDEGTRLVIGSAFSSVNQNGDAANAGHARVFEFSSNDYAWTQMGYAVNGTEANELSGYAVALSGDGTMMATGAPGAISGRGRLSVTQWDAAGNEWVAKGTAIVGVDVGDALGAAVEFASDGTRLAVGAPGMHDGAGAALVYEWRDDLLVDPDWVSMRGVSMRGEAPGDAAGAALAISGDGTRVIFGATRNDGAEGLNTDAGHVRVYDWTAAPDGQSSPPPTAPPPPPAASPPPPTAPPPPPLPSPPPPSALADGRDVDSDGRRRRRHGREQRVRKSGISLARRVPARRRRRRRREGIPVDVRRVGADGRKPRQKPIRRRRRRSRRQNHGGFSLQRRLARGRR
jgi:hypothetical protein